MKIRFRKVYKLLFSILIISLILSSCGNQSVPNSEHKNDKKNFVVYALNHTPVENWDPSIENSSGYAVLNNVYETLLRYEPEKEEIVPVLATSYTKSDDGLIWTFNIRKGVKFHDGTSLDAEAVRFSIQRTIDIGKGVAFIWDPVQEINVKDQYTVEFKLHYSAPLDIIASSALGAFIVSPTAANKENSEDWFMQGNDAGTGPYKLQSFKMGQEVILTKFEEYWKGWEDKHFEKIVFKKIDEPTTRRQLLEKGEVDIVKEVLYEDLEALKNNPNLKIDVSPSYETMIMMLNTEKEPLSNKIVRQAISYAFPYEDVIKYAVGGYATQSIGAIPYGLWGHGEDLFQYNYNLDKAKQLLGEAGYPNGGFKILLTYSAGDEIQKKAGELFKSELSKLNIELELRGMPWEAQCELARGNDTSKRQDIYVYYWWIDIASPHSYLQNMFHSEETTLYNFAYLKNGKIDGIIDEAWELSGTSIKEAEQKYIEVQKYIINEAPAIFAFDKQAITVYNKDIIGLKNNPAYPFVVFFYDIGH